MKIETIDEHTPREFPGIEGVTIRWMIGKKHGAPNFALRVIEVAPGCNTPFHRHDYEHEVIVLEGQGAVHEASGAKHAIQAGATVYIQPNEEHGFYNTGQTTLRFVCVVPHVEGLEPLNEDEAAKVC